MKEKSLLWAYVLWFFGGIFGLHHFYLRRDRHAFVWWTTLGGFGVGWLGEVFRLPRYVRDVNEDHDQIQEVIKRMKQNKRPPFSVNRFTGMLMVGYSWGQMMMLAVPPDEFWGFNLRYLNYLIPLVTALGVWTVGNIGREQGSLKWPLLAAYAAYPIRFYVYDETFWFTLMVLVSALAFDSFSKEWRRRSVRHNLVKWLDVKQCLMDTYQYAQHHGWYEVWKQIIELSDPHGEQNAYKVLGVGPDATQQEITSIWRRLSRENHPDKVKDEVQRRAAQEKFMEIQQAYEILSNSKHRRNRRNKKDNSGPVPNEQR